MGLLSFLSVPAVLFRKHNCHVRGCWRIGHHPLGPYLLCRKHHPDIPDAAPTSEQLENNDGY
jgi:hypothetical protein